MWPMSLLILAAIALGCLQLAIGVAMGRRSARRRAGKASQLDGPHLERFARRLGRLVNGVADDVGEHKAQMARVNQELTEAGASDDAPLADLVLGALAQMVESGARLQDRLARAEDRLQRQAEQLQRQLSEARTDHLTELPNRRSFRDELDRQIFQWQRKHTVFSLMMIDADHFKAVNDRFGHPAGDHVLRSLAQVIRATLRQMDVAARVGGEEFAAILPATGPEDAMRAAERVRAAVASHQFIFNKQLLPVTVSLGVTTVQTADDATTLIERADEALYASKHAGRNCWHYHNGQACQRSGIAPGGAATEPASLGNGGGKSASSAGAIGQAARESPDLHLACRQLRQRLAELVGNQPAIRPLDPSGRRLP